MLTIFKPKFLFKLAWFGLGLFGLAMIVKQYFPDLMPNFRNSHLVKGVQSGMVQNQNADFFEPSTAQPINLKQLTEMNPQQSGQVISQLIKAEITKILESTTTEIKQFPANQVKKIKIGACENLLEEDICSVAKKINCQ
ncbi:MAG: hypothetical protein U0946_03795 [Patescibacteria group bacterium]|nr:hypothetical protein [Patescibacteria group bacterium]